MIKIKSMILLELIFSIALFSIILIYTMNISLSLQSKSYKNLDTTYKNLQLETTRLFLSKNNDPEKLKYENGILYYDGSVLLNKIDSFNTELSNSIVTIGICIQDDICQVWKLKL